jgi:hypothetical protein
MVDRLGKSSLPGETFFHTGNYCYPGLNPPHDPTQPEVVTGEPGSKE